MQRGMASPVLPEQRMGWSLMIFRARATRGLKGPRWTAQWKINQPPSLRGNERA